MAYPKFGINEEVYWTDVVGADKIFCKGCIVGIKKSNGAYSYLIMCCWGNSAEKNESDISNNPDEAFNLLIQD